MRCPFWCLSAFGGQIHDAQLDDAVVDLGGVLLQNIHQELVALAVKLLRDQWKGDSLYWYKKTGVIVWNICKDHAIQGSLFDTVDREKQATLAKAIDEINRKNGHNTVRVAVQGFGKTWHLKNEYLSKQYTTNLDDVIVVKAK